MLAALLDRQTTVTTRQREKEKVSRQTESTVSVSWDIRPPDPEEIEVRSGQVRSGRTSSPVLDVSVASWALALSVGHQAAHLPTAMLRGELNLTKQYQYQLYQYNLYQYLREVSR